MKNTVIIALPLLCALHAQADNRPNIIVIMTDDMGYSDLGCYGSEIRTPNIDYLAQNGLRFTQFYNCGRSCPTRASILTGLYAHQAGVGEMVNDRHLSGYRGNLSKHSVTIAEVMKSAGYHTYMSGKWHVTNVPYGEDMNKAAKDNWPLQRGFERFYGTLHGAGSFWDPSALVRGNEFVSPLNDPEYNPKDTYYYTDAISDHAVRYIKEHDGKKPFFMYVAYTAPHWPMQAPEEEIDAYNGVYDKGYEAVRKDRFERMRTLGLLDKNCALSEVAGDWTNTPNKKWEVRLMQTYAAMISIMDRGVGKIIEELRQTGQLDNTLILFLQDNGGCAENTGRVSQKLKKEELLDHGRVWCQTRGREVTRDGRVVRTGPTAMPGPEDTFIGYGQSWANVSNTPFRKYKSYVHEGGISTPLIAHWPKGIHEKNGIRRSVGHIVDIMATCVELSGKDYPVIYNGNSIIPKEGRSLLPILEKDSEEQDRTIIFEHYGKSALRVGKWKLVGDDMFNGNQIKKVGWKLYDMENDRSEMNDLSKTFPEKVKEMAEIFEKEALRVQILPKIKE